MVDDTGLEFELVLKLQLFEHQNLEILMIDVK